MKRRDRAYLRRWCLKYAHDYLGVRRLPNGVPALVRGFADAIETWPGPTWNSAGYDIGRPLSVALRPYRKRALVA